MHSWNTLLGWAARSGKPRLVADLEERMREEGIEGDVFTNNIRLQVGHSQQQQLNRGRPC